MNSSEKTKLMHLSNCGCIFHIFSILSYNSYNFSLYFSVTASVVPDEDADMVLPPEARFEVAGPVASAAATAAPVVGLEDFFGSSHASSNQDNVSLLDLSMAANQVGNIVDR